MIKKHLKVLLATLTLCGLSLPTQASQGDISGDDIINVTDLSLLSSQWLNDGDVTADINSDNLVNLLDLGIIAGNWQQKAPGVIINEFLASNSSIIADGNGGYSDYIEICNTSDDDINLSNWSLTDNANEMRKWLFPDITIAPQSYLLLFASGKDSNWPYIDTSGYYHTNFKLAADGEYLALVKPDGNITSEFADYMIDNSESGYPPQTNNMSYGRISDSDILPYVYGYCNTPTPETANSQQAVMYCNTPAFSKAHSFCDSSFSLVLSCDKGEIIRYTTDGSTPGKSCGQIYSGPIAVNHTICIRAIAYRNLENWIPSKVITNTYIFTRDTIVQNSSPDGWPTSPVNGQVYDYEMDSRITTSETYSELMDDALLAIPSISIVTDQDNLTDAAIGIYSNASEDGYEWERKASVELINPTGTEGFQINAGLRIRGGSTRSPSNPKHSFRLFFRGEYGESRLEFPLFGDEGANSFDKIDLRTGQNFSWNHTGGRQATWMYDSFSRESHKAMGQPYSRGRWYHLYLNGIYWGIYQTDERPGGDYGQSYFGGNEDDYDTIKSDNEDGHIYATDGSIESYYELWNQINTGVSCSEGYYKVQGMNIDGNRNPTYTRYIDVDNIIDYMLLVFYTGNVDMPLGPPELYTMPRNLYGVFNRTNPDGYKFIAHDCEESLLTSGLSVNRVNHRLSSQLYLQKYCNPFWIHKRLFTNPEYRLKFADHIHKHMFNDGALTITASSTRWERLAGEIELAIIAESARWGDTKTTPAMTKSDWANAVSNVRENYFQAAGKTRNDYVLEQLIGAGLYPSISAPEYSQYGGRIEDGNTITLSAPAGVIYYTIDGSDPRERISSAVSGSATTYSEPIALNKSTVIKARALSGTSWSALTEAVFEVGNLAEKLKISEIMYHSISEPEGEHDYIEICNISNDTINLNMVSFTNGIEYTFGSFELAGGEKVVVVENETDFCALYGNEINIAGEYSGNLSNSGERITLSDALGATIETLKYDDSWYPLTDGAGYSLTRISPETSNDPDSKLSWQASIEISGTPGS